MTHGSPVREHSAGSVLGCLPQDLLAGWLQALGAMGHRGRYFWLTQSLVGSSRGRENWGGLGLFLIPALPVHQADTEDREVPSPLPTSCDLSKGERQTCLLKRREPTPWMFKPLAFPLQPEKDASELEAFYHELTEFSSRLIFAGDSRSVCFLNLVHPLQIAALSFIAFHLLYSTTAPVINHRA